MFYLPGSLYVGYLIQWFITIEMWSSWWWYDDLGWDDNDRRGAGSITMVLAALVGIGVLIWRLTR